jgi:hypothetical protein
MKAKDSMKAKRCDGLAAQALPYEEMIDKQIDLQYPMNDYVVLESEHFKEAKLELLDESVTKELTHYLINKYQSGGWKVSFHNDYPDGLYLELK